MRDKALCHTKLSEDLEATKEGDKDLGFAVWSPLPPFHVPFSVANSFAARPSYPLPFFFSFQLTPKGEGYTFHHQGPAALPLLLPLLLLGPNLQEGRGHPKVRVIPHCHLILHLPSWGEASFLCVI